VAPQAAAVGIGRVVRAVGWPPHSNAPRPDLLVGEANCLVGQDHSILGQGDSKFGQDERLFDRALDVAGAILEVVTETLGLVDPTFE
jgi:hypothetical protein